MMYYLVGSTLNLFFEDELADTPSIYKNILCGSITGGIYKSTLGNCSNISFKKELYRSSLDHLLVAL